MNQSPDLVTLHVWRVARRTLPSALLRMAIDRRRLRGTPGVRFGKLLGTGTGTSFGPADADLTRWAALIVWSDPARAAGFDDSPVGAAWRRIARSAVRLDLRPLTSRGRWAGIEPFGDPGTAGPGNGTVGHGTGGNGTVGHGTVGHGRADSGTGGPVLALTRARLRPYRAVTFWRAVPPVAAALATTPGLHARFGIGEAPLGFQGTVSVWRSAADLTGFAYRHPEHRAAIMRTPVQRWYAEELFARLAVRDVVGDRTVLDWVDHDEQWQ